MHHIDTPPIVTAELTRSRLVGVSILSERCHDSHIWYLLVEQALGTRPAIDQLQRGAGPDQADDKAEHNELHIVALRDHLALILAGQLFDVHGSDSELTTRQSDGRRWTGSIGLECWSGGRDAASNTPTLC